MINCLSLLSLVFFLAMNNFSFLPFLSYDQCSIFLEYYGSLMVRYPALFQEKIFLTEHRSIYTIGYRSSPKDQEKIQQLFPQIPCYKTSRGGEITFHGPGQLMIYPCISLRKRNMTLGHYIETLEIWIEKTLRIFQCPVFRQPHHPGLWIYTKNNEKNKNQKNPTKKKSEKKILSLGLKITQGIALYGMALNIAPQKKYLSSVTLCGLPKNSLTTLQEEGFFLEWPLFKKVLQEQCPFF